MKIDSLALTPHECRALIERRLGLRTAHALRRLEEALGNRRHYPPLDVLPEDSARVVAAYGRRCAYCTAGGELGVDFLVPPRRGGTCHPENLVAACAACTSARRGRHLDVFVAGRLDLDGRAIRARIVRAAASLRAMATAPRGER